MQYFFKIKFVNFLLGENKNLKKCFLLSLKSAIIEKNRKCVMPYNGKGKDAADLRDGDCMTYNEICCALGEAGIENNRAEAAMLICRFCDISRVELFKRIGEDFQSDALDSALIRRCSHYPLQYIFGVWDFCHESYRVNEHTLIPRSDTELLVEKAVRHLPPQARFIDLCTGSGCVAISTLAARPDCHGVAVDLFEETVAIARENAEENGGGERLGFLRADVLDPTFMEPLGYFDAILANPPYIVRKVLNELAEELSYEPRAALDGGEDGLDFYRVIIARYGAYLAENGIMLLEIGYDQAEAVRELAAQAGYNCEIFRDLGNNDRVALLTPAAEEKKQEPISIDGIH